MKGSVRPSSAVPSSKIKRTNGSIARPLTARPASTKRSSSITRSESMTVLGSKIRPVSALTTSDTNIQGHWFYKCPKSGSMPYSHPKYTIPKWKSKSFLDDVQKRSKKCPAPNSYKLSMSWKGKNAQIKGTKRITFTDEIKTQK